MNKEKTLIFSLSAMFFLTASFLVYSWSEPEGTMPDSYQTPINTSATAQTKSGDFSATSFVDANDSSYYINPSGNSIFSGTITIDRPTETNNAATKGYVDEKIAEVAGIVTGAQPLVNGAHSQDDCTSAGGEVVDSDVSYKICRITAASCPSGWTQYKNYSTAEAYTKPFLSFCYSSYYTCAGWTCTASAKAWANTSYTCTNTIKSTYTSDVPCCVARCYAGPSSSYGWNEYFFTATRTQIGCY